MLMVGLKIGDRVEVVKLYSVFKNGTPKHYYGRIGIVKEVNGNEVVVDFGDEVKSLPKEVLKKGLR